MLYWEKTVAIPFPNWAAVPTEWCNIFQQYLSCGWVYMNMYVYHYFGGHYLACLLSSLLRRVSDILVWAGVWSSGALLQSHQWGCVGCLASPPEHLAHPATSLNLSFSPFLHLAGPGRREGAASAKWHGRRKQPKQPWYPQNQSRSNSSEVMEVEGLGSRCMCSMCMAMALGYALNYSR